MTDTQAQGLDALPPCPECESEYTYEMPPLIVCPECAHEFSTDTATADPEETSTVIVDSVGNVLSDGDTVSITKTIKVKGAQQSLKSGMKARNIRLKPEVGTGPEDHNIECKIDGFGQMILKPAVVKKIV
ncbi:alkylphosphonate utilization protein [Corynebacterium diphtheriae]|nr:alkylphosphonate utilization protein [Corynebacterium diphtheriae]CAB0901543.1 alkylphosphonate utilization protein [Corynebacterium diphtheriae]CAB0949885.1 alkylphosphonate utilization protein [Corynebacterium diphtheriae]